MNIDTHAHHDSLSFDVFVTVYRYGSVSFRVQDLVFDCVEILQFRREIIPYLHTVFCSPVTELRSL